jgi:hypothetical protein
VLRFKTLPEAVSAGDREDPLQRNSTQERGPVRDRQKFYAQLNLWEEVA